MGEQYRQYLINDLFQLYTKTQSKFEYEILTLEERERINQWCFYLLDMECNTNDVDSNNAYLVYEECLRKGIIITREELVAFPNYSAGKYGWWVIAGQKYNLYNDWEWHQSLLEKVLEVMSRLSIDYLGWYYSSMEVPMPKPQTEKLP